MANKIDFFGSQQRLHFTIDRAEGIGSPFVYRDDLKEFPPMGDIYHIYIVTSTNIMYRWDVRTETYVPMSSASGGGSVEDNILTYASRTMLPNIGKVNAIYVVTNEDAIYRWDNTQLKYYCCGRNYEKIKTINGGSATTEFE